MKSMEKRIEKRGRAACLGGALACAAAGLAAAETNGVAVPALLAKLERGEQVTIVALGDSNTELTFHTRGHLNWPLLLQVALYEKYGPDRVVMINAGCSGQGAGQALKRLDRDVLRFDPDLVIVCFWDGNMNALREMIATIRAGGTAEILLRTPNPVVAPNMPRVTPAVTAGAEWPGSSVSNVAARVRALGAELHVPGVDHYAAWMEADASHPGPPATNPNKLWMRMSDASHPGPAGHLAFYRDLAPAFGLPRTLSWEF